MKKTFQWETDINEYMFVVGVMMDSTYLVLILSLDHLWSSLTDSLIKSLAPKEAD
jgi:hypothetical protein